MIAKKCNFVQIRVVCFYVPTKFSVRVSFVIIQFIFVMHMLTWVHACMCTQMHACMCTQIHVKKEPELGIEIIQCIVPLLQNESCIW